MLRVRVAGHLGVSHKTNSNLDVKEKSAIRDHITKCRSSIGINNFKILNIYNSKYSLLIAESLYIKQIYPNLNSDVSSVPLYIA